MRKNKGREEKYIDIDSNVRLTWSALVEWPVPGAVGATVDGVVVGRSAVGKTVGSLAGQAGVCPGEGRLVATHFRPVVRAF